MKLRIVVHARRYPGTDRPWARCRGIKAQIADDWEAVTCKACLATKRQQFEGDYSLRWKAYSKAKAALRERHAIEFQQLYQAELKKTDGETP